MDYKLLAFLAKGGTLEDWIHINAINEYFQCRCKVLKISAMNPGDSLHLIYSDGIPIGVSTRMEGGADGL